MESLLEHSYFDKAIEVAYSLKYDYVEYVFWDSRTDKDVSKLIKKWEKIVEVNRNEVIPSNESLQKYFSDETLKIMSNDVRIFVGTSLHVFDFLKNVKDFTIDYSPAILPLFKALEKILYAISIKGYFEYINRNQYKYNNIRSHACIYDRANNRFFLPDHFDIGTGLKILCKFHRKEDKNEMEVVLNTGVEQFLSSNEVDFPKEKIIDFSKNIEQCRIYRNITAHRDRVNRMFAEEAKIFILDTIRIIEKAYHDFKNILMITAN